VSFRAVVTAGVPLGEATLTDLELWDHAVVASVGGRSPAARDDPPVWTITTAEGSTHRFTDGGTGLWGWRCRLQPALPPGARTLTVAGPDGGAPVAIVDLSAHPPTR
jgi:hypothetical protein